jgi:hypothetical protein
MATESTEDTGARSSWLGVLRQRALKVRNWIWAAFRDDTGFAMPLSFAGVAFVIAWLPFSGFVVARHAAGYVAAGVAKSDAEFGSFAAQMVALLLSGCTAALLRRGGGEKATTAAGLVTLVWAVTFAVLPSLVAGWSWLSVLLALVTTLLYDLGLVLVAAGVVLLPNWGRSHKAYVEGSGQDR